MTSSASTTVLPSPGLRARLRRGVTWHLLGMVFNQGSTFAVNVVVANLLGRQLFGEYAMVQSTLLTVATIAQLGIGYTVAKYTAEFRSIDPGRTGRILGLFWILSTVAGVVATLALYAGASHLATAVLHAPHLTSALTIAAGAVLFMVMAGYRMGALAGLEAYPALGVAGAISGSLYFAICSLGAWMAGLSGALSGLVLSALIQWAVLNWKFRREIVGHDIPLSLRGVWDERGVISSFALPAAITGFSTMPALWLANTFLVRQSDGYAQMALYAAANNLRLLVLFVPSILNTVAMSLLNNQKGRGDTDRYRRVFWANMALTAATVVTGALAVVLLGPRLLAVFGRSFGEGFPVLTVLVLSTIPEGLALATYQVVQSHGRIWMSLLAIALPRDIAIALLAYLWTPSEGALGLARAYAVAWTMALLLYIGVSWRIGLRARAAIAN